MTIFSPDILECSVNQSSARQLRPNLPILLNI